MQISFCELRAKEVVNIYNGKRLGNIIDMIIDTRCARVLGIVVPNCNAKFSIFKSNSDVFIPYNNIVKIGKDVILVDLSNISTQELTDKKDKKYNANNIPKQNNNNQVYDNIDYPQ
ncbi:MAG: YlmC/YmxH family sporulation protein [Clostridiales bacterium]|nr:YlmC/YmxH family sporulation protein [Clostridiales bacterium]